MTTESTVKVPEELIGADRAKVTEYVTKQTSGKIQKLADLAAKDPAKYAEKLQEILTGQTAQIDTLYSAVRKAAADAKQAEQKAIEQAEEKIARLKGKIRDAFVPAFGQLETEFLALPTSLSGYVTIERVNGGVNLSVVIAEKFSSGGKNVKAGKRGRKSKWSQIVVKDSSGKEHKFTSLNDARTVFLKPTEQEQTYSKSSFEKRCSEYGFTVTFVDRADNES